MKRYNCLSIYIISLLFISGFVGSQHVAPHYKRPSTVISLNDANFDELIVSGDWVVNFYSPDCKHCNDLKPVWERMAEILSEEAAHNPTMMSVRVAKLDGTLNPSTMSIQGIQYYPSIIYFSEGYAQSTFDVNEQPSLNNLLTWLRSKVPQHRQYAFPQLPFSDDQSSPQDNDKPSSANGEPSNVQSVHQNKPSSSPKSSSTSSDMSKSKNIDPFSLNALWDRMMTIWSAYPITIAVIIYITGFIQGSFFGCLFAMREKLD